MADVVARPKIRAPLSTVPGELIQSDDHLEQDQEHDNKFEPQRASCIDDIGQHLCGLGNDTELAIERFGPLLELILVCEPRIQPLEILLSGEGFDVTLPRPP